MTDGLRSRRPGAFVLGLIVGGLVAGAALLAVWPFPPFGQWSVSVEVNGRDADRHGGVQLVYSDGVGRITQRCVGGCDDVRFRQSTAEGGYVVKVLDLRGGCIAGGEAGYVTNGIDTRLAVEGEDVLWVKGDMVRSTPTTAPAAGRETPIC